MSLFTPTNVTVVLCERGRYREAMLFTFNSEDFAAHGNSYIRLLPNGRTSLSDVFWEDGSSLPVPSTLTVDEVA